MTSTVFAFNRSAKIMLQAAVIGLSTVFCGTLGAETSKKAPGPHQFDKNYTIRLTGTLDTEKATKIIDRLLEISKQSPKTPIEIRINSLGGGIDDGLAIYDVIQTIPNEITTVCEGTAQSMAAFLLTSAGAPGKRYAYPHCELMYHQTSWWSTNGHMTEMSIATGQGNRINDGALEILAQRTGWTTDIIKDFLQRNFYPTPEEAVKMGFIDHIIAPVKSPPPAPQKNKLPKEFCEQPGRQHMHICK